MVKYGKRGLKAVKEKNFHFNPFNLYYKCFFLSIYCILKVSKGVSHVHFFILKKGQN